MTELRDKVAVVTGAASGIGRALAERCCDEGMKVVLADVEEAALLRTERDLKERGATVLAVRTDVSNADQVEEMARTAQAAFGAVHLLFNNAGVAAGSSVWETSLNDWQWILGVNLWGVIHGIRTFVPLMLSRGAECHIVNTASIAGMIAGPGLGAYKVTKHAVVTLSETLYHELAARKSRIGVSVLCPGWVRTRILHAERNRPEELRNTQEPARTRERSEMQERIARAVIGGTPPRQVANAVFQAIRANRFYILPHPETKPMVQLRFEDILRENNPTLPSSEAEGSRADQLQEEAGNG